MAFQAAVGAWFAAHLISSTSVASKLGVGGNLLPVRMQFETTRALDDIAIQLEGGRQILIQCKTNISVSETSDSPLGKTIDQLVGVYLEIEESDEHAGGDRAPVAVLAVSGEAAASAEEIEEALRCLDSEVWDEALARVNARQRQILEVFQVHVRRSWRNDAEPSGKTLTELARMFRVVRFDVSEGRIDWREASRLVGTRLYGDIAFGDNVMTALLAQSRLMIRSGAAADANTIVGHLRQRGFEDTKAPRFNEDIDAIRNATTSELARLDRHRRLPIHGGVPVSRQCLPALEAAIAAGSLLVTGEPGAGKTGLLVQIVDDKLKAGEPAILVSVDQFSGISTGEGLRQEMGIRHQLVDVMAAWPGSRPGILVVDALDASRGGPFESVIVRLIEDVLRRCGDRWAVLASVRTFDLVNGRRFRELVRGDAPSPQHADSTLRGVRHFRVPSLSNEELQNISEKIPELEPLTSEAPQSVRHWLGNVFNLSLATQMLADGEVSAESLAKIEAQGELIKLYEDERISSSRLQRAVAEAIATMIVRRRLVVRRIDLAHEATDDLIKIGVLLPNGDRVSFAHHVLFDHAASRFYLRWDDADELQAQVSSDSTVGLLLGPALRFAMDGMWRGDAKGRSRSWHLVARLCSLERVDPVVVSVALRTSAERVEQSEDVIALCELVAGRLIDGTDVRGVGSMLARLARFVGMVPKSSGAAKAWAEVARQAAKSNESVMWDGSRVLLWSLFSSGIFRHAEVLETFGGASRWLLKRAWASANYPPIMAGTAIRFVAKTFDSERLESRKLLEQIFEDEHFKLHAHEEVSWLAESIGSIIPVDPEFACQVYQNLFARPAPMEGKTWIGGLPSKILPLTSTREQDYKHARWHLQQALDGFLSTDEAWATRAINRSVIGEHSEDEGEGSHELVASNGPLPIINDRFSWNDWRNDERQHGDERSSLSALVRYLLDCTIEQFATVLDSAKSESAISASVLSRILGVASERPDLPIEATWELASRPQLLETTGLSKDCIDFLASAYPRVGKLRQTAFEDSLVEWIAADPEVRGVKWRRAMAGRLLSLLGDQELQNARLSELRDQLAGEGSLRGNPSFVSFSSSWGRADRSITDSMLEDRGIDTGSGPDAALREPARKLEELLRAELKTVGQVSAVWLTTKEMLVALAGSTNADELTLRSSWGEVGSAVEKILRSDAYAPSNEGHPSLVGLLELLRTLAGSPYPEDGGTSSSLTWGNWDIRVYAASGLLALCTKDPQLAIHIRDDMEALLRDPVPTVRLQIAQSVNVLWDVARDQMWSLIELIAQQEKHSGVLAFFVSGPLSRLAGVEPERCERLVGRVLEVLDESTNPEDRESLLEPVGYLAAQLWVGRARPAAKAWIEDWRGDTHKNRVYLRAVVSALRGALFAAFEEDADLEGRGIQDRARTTLHDVLLAAAAEASVQRKLLHTVGEAGSDLNRYRSADGLIEHACNQLYFGSGAFRSDNGHAQIGLSTDEAKRGFLNEYKATLELFRTCASARTVHQLIELYEYLIPGEPALVFDAVSDLLTGAGVDDGYQYESLGSEAFVRLIRRYLADYRYLFDDEPRRGRLLAVLELFSDAGWPEALKLLYELPDLLR